MAKYLLIESRDPFENNEVAQQYDLAASLVKESNAVTLFLVQNGVLPVVVPAKVDTMSKVSPPEPRFTITVSSVP